MKILTIILFLTITSMGINSSFAANQSEYELATQKVAYAKENFDVNPTAINQNDLNAALDSLQRMSKPHKSNYVFRAQVTESEPNDAFGTADAMSVGDSGTGAIDPLGDRDFWSVSGVSMGDIVFVTIDTELSNTTQDSEMSVFENDGTTLIEFDDDSGDGLASAVVAVIPTAGSIFFEFNEFDDNGTIGPYEVFQTVQSPGAVVAETEPNDTFGTASPATALMNTGVLVLDDAADFFSFEATIGDRLAVIVNTDPDNDTTLTNVQISILDTDGSTVLANEAPFAVMSQNTAIFTAVNTGIHYVQLTNGDAGTPTSSYSFVVVGSSGTVPVELQSFSID